MAYFAVLNNDDVVCNLIVADSKSIAEEVTQKTCIEYTLPAHIHIGFSYDSTTEEFVDPTAEETPAE